jgi:uncharacterized protein
MAEPHVKEGMLCPVCRTDLMMTDRQGVEIDYCPRCRGVWLDRGELDKIIERNADASAPARRIPERAGAEPYGRQERRGRYGGNYDDDDDDRGGRGGRRSWLGDMFDFGD